MKLPTREQLLSADLPVERPCVSVTPSGVRTPCVYRFTGVLAANTFGNAERVAMRKRHR